MTLRRARAGRERGAEPRTAPPEPAAGGRGSSLRDAFLPPSSLRNFWWGGEGGREPQCISAPPPGRGRSSSRRPRAPRHRRPPVPPLTEWFTPHMRTLSSGSLARNNFTFCATKCFFLVLVLLAMTEATVPGAAMAREAGREARRERAQHGSPAGGSARRRAD